MDEKKAARAEQSKAEALEETLADVQAEISRRYSLMGKQLLALAEEQQQAIDSLVDEAIRIRRRLAKVRGERDCPCCMAPNEHDSVYCRRCGHKLEGGRI